MAASTQQKLDYLFKKIGYTASKTGVAEDETGISGSPTRKAPFAEAIPSPLQIASSSLWADSNYIPSTPPGSDSDYVKVYLKATSGHRMTVDSTVSGNRAFIPYSTYNDNTSGILGDWIDTQYGDGYIVQVFRNDPSSGTEGVDYFKLSAAGSGDNDTWFFDYSSGILNFNGTQVPDYVTGTNIYIVGYRYIGAKGAQPAGGIGTFSSLVVSGVSTFNNTVNLPDNKKIQLGDSSDLQLYHSVSGGGSTSYVDNNTGPLYIRNNVDDDDGGNIIIEAKAGKASAVFQDDEGVRLYYDNAEKIRTTNEGVLVSGGTTTGTLSVTGVSTFGADATFNGLASLNGDVTIGNAISDAVTIVSRVHSDFIPNNSGARSLGQSDKTWQLYANNVSVAGISTFTGAIDANGDLDVDGHTELDDVNITGVSTFNNTINLDSTVSSNNSEITVLGGKTLQINSDAQRLRLKGTGTTGAVESVALQLNTNAEGGSTQHALVANQNSSVKIYHSGNEKLRTIGVGVTVYGNTETQTLNVSGVSTFAGAIDANGDLDVDGHTELDNVNVSGAATFTSNATFGDDLSVAGVSTFTNAIYADGGIDVSVGLVASTAKISDLTLNRITYAGVSGELQDSSNLTFDGTDITAASAKVSDLTDNRLVIAGTSGALEDSSKVTFDGTTFAIVGDATFSGNVTIGGTLTKDDVTNIDSVGVVTAGKGLRATTGGLVVTSGVSTFSDSAYLPDNSKINFGDAASPDLEIYHSGSHSYIKEFGTGGLYLDANQVTIGSTDNSKTYANFTEDAQAKLYYNNSTKFETTSHGAIVTGVLTATTFSGSGASLNSIPNGALDNSTVSYGGISLSLGGTDATPAFDLTDAINYPYTSLTGIVTHIVGDTTPQLGGNLDGNSKDIYGVGIITATTLDISGNIDVDGHTELDDVNVSGTSTLTTVDINDGFIDNTVIGATVQAAGSFANLIATKGTFTGYVGLSQGLNVTGVSTFTGAIDANGNLDVDGHTELDDVNVSGAITATTFTGNLAGTVNTAAQPNITSLGTLTSLDVSGNITGAGDLTLTDTDDGSSAGPELKLFRNSATPDDADYLGQIKFAGESDTGVERNYAKITGKILDASNTNEDGILEFAHIKAGSQTITARFRSDSLQLLNGTNLTVDGTSTFTGNVDIADTIYHTGDSNTKIRFPANDTISFHTSGDERLRIDSSGNIGIGTDTPTDPATVLNTSVTSVGILTAYQLYGDGSKITGITTGTWGVTTGDKGTGNLYAGTLAGENSDSDTCYNIAAGYKSGCALNAGDHNVFLGSYSGESTTDGNCNVAIGYSAGKNLTNNSAQVFIGKGAGLLGGEDATSGLCVNSVAIGSCAGKCRAHYDVFIGYHAGCSNVDGKYNVILGSAVGTGVTDGDCNIMIGRLTGCSVTTGNQNIFLGERAGQCVTSSCKNIFIGNSAGYSTSAFAAVGAENIALGSNAAMCLGVNAQRNIMIGSGAGEWLKSGCCNIAIGPYAGQSNDGGIHNTFLGAYAGANNTSGCYNIAIGKFVCLPSATASHQFAIGCCKSHWITGDANFNVGIGTNTTAAVGVGITAKLSVGIVSAYMLYGCGINLTGIATEGTAGTWTQDAQGNLVAGTDAGKDIVNGDTDPTHNILIGECAGCTMDGATAGCNIFLGLESGKETTSGCENIFLGKSAGHQNTSGAKNIAIGRAAGYHNLTGAHNISMGCLSHFGVADCNFTRSIAIGYKAGYAIQTGECNIMIGAETGSALTTGGDNVFIGSCVGRCNAITGSRNVSIGAGSGKCICSGANNTILGAEAAVDLTSGSANVFLGRSAGVDITTGTRNAVVGCAALRGNGSSHNASCNAAFGWRAGYAMDSGNANTLLGQCAGAHITTGSNNVMIGSDVNPPSETGDTQLAIGCCASHWITGNSDFNVGIGTTNPNASVGVGNTAKLSVGIVSAYMLYGCGINLTGIATEGAAGTWTQDAYANLKAGTDAGGAFGSNTLGNIAIGSSSAALLDTGDYNVSIGTSAGVNMTSGLSNVVIGHCAAYHSSGSSHRNIYMGQEAGKCKQGGGSNIGLGLYALYGSSTPGNNTSSGNIALGECAGKANTSGSYNVLFGRSAGENITTGTCNVIGGSWAASSGTITSQYNIIFGKEAAKNITSGGDNIISGYRAVGSGVLTGSYNAIFGREAGCSLTSGSDNFIYGRRAACGATSAHNSIIIGYLAASGATLTGNQNILLGTNVAKNLTGAYNVMFGLQSGCQLGNANHNVFVGHYTAKNNTGNMCYSVAIGHKTDLPITAGNTQLAIGCNGSYWMVGNSSFNVGIGTTNPDCAVEAGNTKKLSVGIVSAYQLYGDGQYLSGVGFSPDADENLIAGTDAGKCIDGTNACYNVFLGLAAGKYSTTNNNSVLIGHCAGCGISGCTGGYANQYIGYLAGGKNQTGHLNTFIGCVAGQFITSGNSNVAIGNEAARSITVGSGNVVLGSNGGSSLDSGICNIFIGVAAGNNISSGDRNVAIGNHVCLPSATGDCQLAIGAGTKRWITGDELFNVGIGTDKPTDDPVSPQNTAKLVVGIVTANYLYGDGQYLSGVGFSPDSQENLFAGTDAGAAKDADTCFNIGIGQSAGKALNEGDSNIFIGCFAAPAVTSGSGNLAIGERAGKLWQTASQSIAIGYRAGSETATNSNNNIFLGTCAGRYASGHNNVFIGRCTAICGHYGSSAVFIGAWAGAHNGSGENTYVGGGSGYYNKGQFNTLLGYYAGAKTCGSYCSTWIGAYTGCGANSCAGNTGDCNVGMGNRAGRGITSGHSVVMIGNEAGCKNSSGSQNVYLGQRAAYHGETGSCNVAIGNSVFLPITNGDSQLVIGVGSSLGWINGNANWNVGIGTTNPDIAVGVGNTAKLSVGIVSAYMLYGCGANLTGIDAGWEPDSQENLVAGTSAGAAKDADTCFNVMIGACAGKSLNEGDDNVFLGRNAGCSNTSGDDNVYIGADVGKSNVAANNVAIGNGAAGKLTGAADNVYIGYQTGEGLFSGTKTGSQNIALGKYALAEITTGGKNVVLGCSAGNKITSGGDNIALGQLALGGAAVTGSYNFAGGYSALRNVTSGTYNIALGGSAGCLIGGGDHNIIIGRNAGDAITSGSSNIAIGKDALGAEDTNSNGSIAIGENALLLQNTTTLGNIAIGKGAAAAVSTGGESVYIGYDAGGSTTGSKNVVIGYLALTASAASEENVVIGRDAGRNTTGSQNTIVGDAAGDASGDGSYNTFIGKNSGSAVTNGDKNTFLGYGSGDAVTTGCCNVVIGHGADVASDTGNNQLAIGIDSNNWITGDSSYNITVNTISASNFNSTSDIRLKTNIQPIGDPIGKVKQIEGVSFNWKKDNKPALGVIADQVEKILPELVHGDDPKTVNYNGLIGLLIETVKEQQIQIDALKDRISKLE